MEDGNELKSFFIGYELITELIIIITALVTVGTLLRLLFNRLMTSEELKKVYKVKDNGLVESLLTEGTQELEKPSVKENTLTIPKGVLPTELRKIRTILQVKGYNTARVDEVVNIIYEELKSMLSDDEVSERVKNKFVQDKLNELTKPLTLFMEKMNNSYIEAEDNGKLIDMSLYDMELEVLIKTITSHLNKIVKGEKLVK